MIDWLLHLDKTILLALNGDLGPTADTIFYWASAKTIWAPLYALILWMIYRRYGWKTTLASFLFILLCVGICDQLCNLFKEGGKKFRPSHDPEIQAMVHVVDGYRGKLYGTISAHSAISFAIARFSSLVIKNRNFTILIFLWATFVAYSRIYLGLHFPLDLIGGALLGILTGWAMFRLFQSKALSKIYPFRTCISNHQKS